jgi:cyclin B
MSKFGFSNENISRSVAAKPVSAPMPGPSRRRILGDITNSHVDDDNRDASRKPAYEVENRVQTAAPVMESRIYMQRPHNDIDANPRDLENPQMAASYANDIFENFFNLEREYRVNPNYMSRQETVNEKMRCILIDWLVEVHLKFRMALETLFITVQIIDRYLQVRNVRRCKLQLVGVSALLVASKYEEIYPPQIKELIYITDKAYTKQDILEMEADILSVLDYQFCVPTTHTFLCRFLKAAHAERGMVQLCCYLVERSLQEYTLLKYLPSQIAAATVLIARISLKKHNWSPTLLKYTTWDEADLAPCVEEFKNILSSTNAQQMAVKTKYSSSKFGAAAKMALAFN